MVCLMDILIVLEFTPSTDYGYILFVIRQRDTVVAQNSVANALLLSYSYGASRKNEVTEYGN